jgi:serine/threonine protein kinase
MPKSTSVEKPAPKQPERSGVPDPLKPGKLFAWFELQRELDSGPTGAVWLAQDHSFGRPVDQVALKFLPKFIASEKTLAESLKNQIRQRTALKHPNILRVYDLVESKGGVAIQMEYLDGQGLSSLRLARKNQIFEARDLGSWVKELCEALEYAHKDIGLIHGDIVPAGLIIDSAGNLQLKDFGIENCIAEAMSRLKVSDPAGETLSYKSPQRAAGEQPVITDDLYSLGAILYELLTGTPPFRTGEIGVAVTGKILPSISDRRAELGIAGEIIPKQWEETVAACLAKDPAQRPQSAAEVKNRLKIAASAADVGAKSIVQLEPGSIAKKLLPLRMLFTRKHWLAIAGILLVLASGSAIAYFSFHLLTGPKVVKIVPASATGFPRRETTPSVLTPFSKLNPTPRVKASPTPSAEVNPTPSVEVNPTPSVEVNPTPSAKVNLTPSVEVSPTPSVEVNPTPSAKVNPTPSVEVSPTPSVEVDPTSSAQEAAAKGDSQAAPSPTPLDPKDADAIKEEVVRRINAIPGITAEKKANLIEKMHRARSMERLAVIPFDNRRSTLRRAATDELLKAFDTPEMRDRLSDPTIILVVAGYADPGGNADRNLRISQARAENVCRILKEQAKLLNAMQTIGMGGTELLDSKQPGQNRAVEIWAVVPL